MTGSSSQAGLASFKVRAPVPVVTDSFITQAEEALTRFDDPDQGGVIWAVDLATALRALLGEYKRLTTGGKTQYRTTRTFRGVRTVHVGRESRFATEWVPVEGEDQT